MFFMLFLSVFSVFSFLIPETLDPIP